MCSSDLQRPGRARIRKTTKTRPMTATRISTRTTRTTRRMTSEAYGDDGTRAWRGTDPRALDVRRTHCAGRRVRPRDASGCPEHEELQGRNNLPLRGDCRHQRGSAGDPDLQWRAGCRRRQRASNQPAQAGATNLPCEKTT